MELKSAKRTAKGIVLWFCVSVARFTGFGFIYCSFPSTEVLGYYHASATRTKHRLSEFYRIMTGRGRRKLEERLGFGGRAVLESN